MKNFGLIMENWRGIKKLAERKEFMKARTFNSDGAITGIYSVAKQSYDIGKYDQCIKLLQALNMNQGSDFEI